MKYMVNLYKTGKLREEYDRKFGEKMRNFLIEHGVVVIDPSIRNFLVHRGII